MTKAAWNIVHDAFVITKTLYRFNTFLSIERTSNVCGKMKKNCRKLTKKQEQSFLNEGNPC